jgi:hypothetical protein
MKSREQLAEEMYMLSFEISELGDDQIAYELQGLADELAPATPLELAFIQDIGRIEKTPMKDKPS